MGGGERSDRTGGLAQPGLKATLQALGAEVLCLQGDQGTPALSLSASASGTTLLSRHSNADFSSELSDKLTSVSVCFFINVCTKMLHRWEVCPSSPMEIKP